MPVAEGLSVGTDPKTRMVILVAGLHPGYIYIYTYLRRLQSAQVSCNKARVPLCRERLHTHQEKSILNDLYGYHFDPSPGNAQCHLSFCITCSTTCPFHFVWSYNIFYPSSPIALLFMHRWYPVRFKIFPMSGKPLTSRSLPIN